MPAVARPMVTEKVVDIGGQKGKPAKMVRNRRERQQYLLSPSAFASCFQNRPSSKVEQVRYLSFCTCSSLDISPSLLSRGSQGKVHTYSLYLGTPSLVPFPFDSIRCQKRLEPGHSTSPHRRALRVSSMPQVRYLGSNEYGCRSRRAGASGVAEQ